MRLMIAVLIASLIDYLYDHSKEKIGDAGHTALIFLYIIGFTLCAVADIVDLAK